MNPNAPCHCPRRLLPRATTLALLAAAALASATRAGASDIAVRRGQTTFDPRGLPPVCIEIATVGTAIPLNSVVLEDGDTHAEQRLIVSSVFGSAHPDLLTAYTPDHKSLSLPIVRLRPGRYMVRQLEFVAVPGVRATTTVTFDVSTPEHGVWFEVKAGSVNDVGGISVWADWNNALSRLSSNDNQRLRQASFASQTSVTQTMARDAKWACDVIPCMIPLPLVVSPIHVN